MSITTVTDCCVWFMMVLTLWLWYLLMFANTWTAVLVTYYITLYHIAFTYIRLL